MKIRKDKILHVSDDNNTNDVDDTCNDNGDNNNNNNNHKNKNNYNNHNLKKAQKTFKVEDSPKAHGMSRDLTTQQSITQYKMPLAEVFFFSSVFAPPNNSNKKCNKRIHQKLCL